MNAPMIEASPNPTAPSPSKELISVKEERQAQHGSAEHNEADSPVGHRLPKGVFLHESRAASPGKRFCCSRVYQDGVRQVVHPRSVLHIKFQFSCSGKKPISGPPCAVCRATGRALQHLAFVGQRKLPHVQPRAMPARS